METKNDRANICANIILCMCVCVYVCVCVHVCVCVCVCILCLYVLIYVLCVRVAFCSRRTPSTALEPSRCCGNPAVTVNGPSLMPTGRLLIFADRGTHVLICLCVCVCLIH